MNRMLIVFATAFALPTLPVNPLLSVIASVCVLLGWWALEQQDIAGASATHEAVERTRLALELRGR